MSDMLLEEPFRVSGANATRRVAAAFEADIFFALCALASPLELSNMPAIRGDSLVGLESSTILEPRSANRPLAVGRIGDVLEVAAPGTPLAVCVRRALCSASG